jgi:hypothetical protein
LNLRTTEHKIFALCSEIAVSGRECGLLYRLLAQVEDKNVLMAHARREGMEGFLYKSVAACKVLDTFSLEQQQALRLCYHRIAAKNAIKIYDLENILGALKKDRIEIIVIQGMDLLINLYDDIGIRPMDDIDLWVLPDDFNEFSRHILDLGYTKDPYYPHTFRKNTTTLDVHTHIVWADRIKSRALFLSQNQIVMYRDTIGLEIGGQTARRFNRYDRVLYLMLHVLKHYAACLIWLVDIKQLILGWNASDWKIFMRRCQVLGQKKPVSYVLFLLERLLDFKLSAGTRQELGLHGLTLLEKSILKRREKDGALPQWAPLFLLSTGKGLGNRFRYIGENIFPRPEILRQIFAAPPEKKPWVLYLMRCRQICQKFLCLLTRT